EDPQSLLGGFVIAKNLEFLALTCEEQDKLTEASGLYSQALKAYETPSKRDDTGIVFCLEAQARVLRRLGRLSEAAQLDSRAARARAEWPGMTGSNGIHAAAPRSRQ